MSLPPATPVPASASPAAFDCEVLVVGGGPAGSTIAALLAERGRDVILAEKGRHPRFHIGESLLPANAALFDRLGVRAEVERFGMTKYGAEFVSPDHDHQAMIDFAEAWDKSMPYAWQVRRSELDELLFRNAASEGRAGPRRLPRAQGRVRRRGRHGRGRARRRREADLADALPRRRHRPRHAAGEPVPLQGEESASTTARRSTATSAAPGVSRAGSKATSRSSGSTTAGSGRSRSPTASPASARSAGRTT